MKKKPHTIVEPLDGALLQAMFVVFKYSESHLRLAMSKIEGCQWRGSVDRSF